MVKTDKSPLPPEISIRSERDYHSDVVFDLLARDCRNKCYICEDKEPTALNVEHRVSHKGDPALKYDWNNLLLCCAHCNGTKGTAFDGIIDPTKVDPEEYIELSISAVCDLTEKVIVKKTKGGEDVDSTVKLLDRVYNGDKTAVKRHECTNLKNKIMKEIVTFRQYIRGYKEEPDLGYERFIAEEISRNSAFAAFKRGLVRNDPETAGIFAEILR
jgi:hypothetical protein